MREDRARRMASEFVRYKRGYADEDPSLWQHKYEQYLKTWQINVGGLLLIVSYIAFFVWCIVRSCTQVQP